MNHRTTHRNQHIARTKPRTGTLETQLKEICKEHGGLVSLNGYAVVDLNLYEVKLK